MRQGFEKLGLSHQTWRIEVEEILNPKVDAHGTDVAETGDGGGPGGGTGTRAQGKTDAKEVPMREQHFQTPADFGGCVPTQVPIRAAIQS